MRNLALLFLGILLIGCSSTQSVVDPVKEKQLKEWIDSKQLRLVAETASPLLGQDLAAVSFLLPNGSTPNRIILTGGNDVFELIGDKANADLPYFGTRQLGAEISQNRVGVLFKENYTRYKVEYNEKKKFYTVKLRVHTKYRESFNIVARVYLNHRAVLTINSSHRTAIAYDGYVTALKDTSIANK